VQGAGCTILSKGFRFLGLSVSAQGLGFQAQGLGFRTWE